MSDLTTLYLLIIAFLVLGFIYLILAIYCTTCLKVVYGNPSSNFFARTFDIYMFLTCVTLTTL